MTQRADRRFEPDTRELRELTQQVLEQARRSGASTAEVAVSRSQGFSATVRMGEVETVEHNRDKNLVVSVYLGNQTGSASSSDFSPAAVADTVRAACSIAKYTASDPCAGLADPAQLAREPMDLDIHHPWNIDVAAAIELARECEGAALATDRRLVNSEGATVASHSGSEVYANSHGFTGASAGTRHSISCAVVGEQDGAMQRDYWYTAARHPAELEDAVLVGQAAAKRTLRRLGARQMPTRQCPVLYEAPVASSLLSHFTAAVRGSSLYRKASFLLDQLQQPVFSDGVRIYEQPHLPRAIGSAWFDNEGVATRDRDLVTDGVLQGYVLDTYSGCKLGMATTGNAGGVRNLTIEPGPLGLAELLGELGTGLLVTELIGAGINMVTGDYSRGAVGFWVENGEIQYPVEEITVAGNLASMFRDVMAVGNDLDTRRNIRTGSILVNNLTVAGS